MTVRRSVVIALSVWGLAAASPQQALVDPGGPVFEAASVRPNTSGEPGGSFDMQPGSQLVVVNYTLHDIILHAHRGNQMTGGPGWIASERFDIVAKAPDGVARHPNMLRALLADRFKLRLHRESRPMPIYALVPARADRRLGPGLRPTPYDCAAVRAARQRGETVPRPAAARNGPFCGASSTGGRLLASGYTLADVAQNLSRPAGRPVEDRTGITGIYEVELSWTPSQAPPGAPIDPNGPSIFTAVDEQLGLKLEPATGSTDVLVIDSVERPTPD